MTAYFCVTANLQAFGYKRFHFTIDLKIYLSVWFGPDLLISFGSTVQNWNCDNPRRILVWTDLVPWAGTTSLYVLYLIHDQLQLL